jgi:hypothetical protein
LENEFCRFAALDSQLGHPLPDALLGGRPFARLAVVGSVTPGRTPGKDIAGTIPADP